MATLFLLHVLPHCLVYRIMPKSSACLLLFKCQHIYKYCNYLKIIWKIFVIYVHWGHCIFHKADIKKGHEALKYVDFV